jgi:hypothetical protein
MSHDSNLHRACSTTEPTGSWIAWVVRHIDSSYPSRYRGQIQRQPSYSPAMVTATTTMQPRWLQQLDDVRQDYAMPRDLTCHRNQRADTPRRDESTLSSPLPSFSSRCEGLAVSRSLSATCTFTSTARIRSDGPPNPLRR